MIRKFTGGIILVAFVFSLYGCIDSSSSSGDVNGSGDAGGDETSIDEMVFAGQSSENDDPIQLSVNESYEMSWDISHGELLSVRVRLSEDPEYDTGDPKVFGCDDGLSNGDSCPSSTSCSYNNENELSCDVTISDQESSADTADYISNQDSAYLVMEASSFVSPFFYQDETFVEVEFN